MPLNRQYLASYPFLYKDDWLTLHPDMQLLDSGLYDVPLGAKHSFAPSTCTVLAALHTGASLNALRDIAHKSRMQTAQLVECLGFLNRMGALQRTVRYRSLPLREAKRLHDMLLGISYAPILVRSSSATLSLAACIIRACSAVLAASLLLGAGLANFVDHTLLLATWLYAMGLFVASLFIHEKAHLLVLARLGEPAILLHSRLRIGIVHRNLQPPMEIMTAVAGPLAGSLICCIAVMGGILYQQALLAITGGVIGIIHTLSLLPWYGDGKSIKQSRQLTQ